MDLLKTLKYMKDKIIHTKMYKIKQILDDFIVNEVIDVKLNAKGSYSYFILKKKDYATPSAVEKIAKFLNVPVKKIGYAGAKDRRAITTQRISIEGLPDRLKGFKDDNIKLEYKGRGDTAVYLGRLKGNDFEIVIRNIKKKPKKISKFLNLFDKQRFSMNNVAIGRAIVKKDFKKAVEILIKSNGYYERSVKENYQNTNDAVNSLRKIPHHVLMFFIHAYQSELWNQYAERLGNYKKNIDLPIVGFGTEIKDDKIRKAVEDVMNKERITHRDFIIRQIPELSSEGSSRRVFSEVKKLNVGKLEDDELNKGMKKIKLKFFLDKGSYATMAIKNMFIS